MKNQKKNIDELIGKINKVAARIKRSINIMEVCGTHTRVISRNGIRRILPENIRLLSGPGCPVCVTAQEDIDSVVQLALAGIPIATYGDMLRVPGYFGSLEDARSKGAKVFAVYSVLEALELKKKYDGLVFFGIGFDTTAPMTAVALEKGLVVYSAHKLFLPAMDALLGMGEIKIDGFISPGHVSTIVGSRRFEHMDISQVITGFEAEDVLVGIYMLLGQIAKGEKKVENEYARSVKCSGNLVAQEALSKAFRICDGNWRGFGIIPKSGLEVKNPKLNAKLKYRKILSRTDFSRSKKPNGCRCGEVIRGLVQPKECPMFGKTCFPEKPFGPCMVSEEGACSIQYHFDS